MVQIRRFQLIKLNSQYKHLPWIGLRSRKTVYPAIRTCQRLRTMFFAHYFFYCRTASNRSSPHSVWQSGSKTRHSGSRSRFRIKAAIRGAWLGWYDHERKPGEWRADFHGRYFWSLNLLHFRLVTISVVPTVEPPNIHPPNDMRIPTALLDLIMDTGEHEIQDKMTQPVHRFLKKVKGMKSLSLSLSWMLVLMFSNILVQQ